ncbi:Protein pxr1 [Lachnellula hyalina]|uniref:PinX1-related protein 1 n=1 Tax=Lachnellula hyalina TaxID=1316788 RepID=A0A8H8R5Y1_9HELO|nr:Protein pxr1 [Lachnellula hyalina]TVY28943.1 Protein pxr1 [Lachnellula hyalina]
MGLSEGKKRIKLSHDPNNTAWTNDSSSFGLKMMTAQGWQPGALLGAKDAPHAEFHTAANASHIRVMLKDDNLGLGAKIGSGVGHGECTGLDMFKNILGRLNGKEEDEIAKEQRSRDDLRRAVYTERKWGSQRFVKGGFLIGDKIQDLIDGEADRLRKLGDESSNSNDTSSESESEEEAPAPVEKTKKSKKRKADAIEEAPEVVAVKVKKSKKKRKLEASSEDAEEVVAKKAKKSKKDRKSKGETDDTSDEARKRRKKERKERRKEKEIKKNRKEKDKSGSEETTKTSKKKSKREKSGLESSESSQATTKENTPMIPTPAPSSGTSTPMMQGRHAVRSRNIAQKRLAHMDIASLNQIFMIKS